MYALVHLWPRAQTSFYALCELKPALCKSPELVPFSGIRASTVKVPWRPASVSRTIPSCGFFRLGASCCTAASTLRAQTRALWHIVDGSSSSICF